MACTPLLSEEDLYRFRTKQCLRLAKGGCEFGLDRCQYSHSAEWIRRCPYYISLPSYLRYIPVVCPFFMKKGKQTDQDEEHRSAIFRNSLFLTNKDGSVNNNFYKYIEEKNQSKCPLGVECPLAHSQEEIDYHPLLYKTKRCEDYMHAKCKRYYCPNLHGLAEQRKIKEYFIPFCSKIDIPPYPNVTVVSKIQYGSFKGQNQGRSNGKETTSEQQRCNSTSPSFNYPHGKNNNSHMGGNRMTATRGNKSVDVKYNSIKIPYHENKLLSLQNFNNHDKRLSTYCYDHHYNTYENNTLTREKKKNSIFSYLNNYDYKYTLYLNILQKFMHLFNLDISDMDSGLPMGGQFPSHVQDPLWGCDPSNEYPGKKNPSGVSLSEQNDTPIWSSNLEGLPKEDTHLQLPKGNIFLNKKYSHILDHIINKNLELTKNKIRESNHSAKSTYTDIEDNLYKTTSNDNSNACASFNQHLDNQMMTPEESDNETYESFLNLLTHVMCLLYFTTDSRAHSSFDLYTHELAKRIHCESKKMRDISMEKYLPSTIKELI
ncbi:zinc finger protein, putative [Plasmodium knowlesi strain H]|uniref:Zinc finger protein, putative n=3 Tax=Plasmodium knowlesi TaxID=5850 RepID=A0A1A7VWN5_PLAKH|nr:zinc finger protein, putative [Plasmodium knowlesi strain H]OTN67958.1 putative Zinc finger protein [Plasmodium knowlesi]CAA9986906.1 zinc finger protein, putative [Plasmodium knowlesi strain H]SBO26532.1 zinc finger protein, putative [Plasmodium knowlesi strain H]SBO28110.1 zinc finger protein, putative [Plasmodium knowlesi strain H]VVS76380.1 zinc finger protein, putative [Plasmodium knowlesi strain H]